MTHRFLTVRVRSSIDVAVESLHHAAMLCRVRTLEEDRRAFASLWSVETRMAMSSLNTRNKATR